MTTSAETINDRLTQWFDPVYSDGIYRKMNYAFGHPWESKVLGGAMASGGRFPDYADIVCDFVETGSSRRILNAQCKATAKIMYNDVAPEFTQVPKHMGEVRKQFWLARAGGQGYCDGEWADEFASAFMEADSLGAGFVELGLETNPESGFQRITLRHSPTILTIVDRTQVKLSKARGVCFVKYIAPDVAYGLYGRKEMQKYVKPLHDQITGTPMRMVRVFDYWDLGCGVQGKRGYCGPTHALIPGDMANAPLLIEENTFGRLPLAWCSGYYAPGMRHPVGRIEMQMGTQEAINEAERIVREFVHKSSGYWLADVTQINNDDLRRLRKGETLPFIRLKNGLRDGQQPPIIPIASQQMSESIIHWMQVLERQYNDDSQSTEYDRGNIAAGKRTATEIEMLQSRTQDSGNWMTRQAAKMYRRAVECGLSIASKFDRDPVVIDVWGNNVTLNDPNAPGSTIDNFLTEPAKVVINADDLTYQDTMQKKALRTQELMSYTQLLALPDAQLLAMGLNPQWYRTEVVKNAGDEPSEVLATADQMAALQQQAGPQVKVMEVIDAKMFAMLTPTEQAEFLQEVGITPDPRRAKMPVAQESAEGKTKGGETRDAAPDAASQPQAA